MQLLNFAGMYTIYHLSRKRSISPAVTDVQITQICFSFFVSCFRLAVKPIVFLGAEHVGLLPSALHIVYQILALSRILLSFLPV